MKLEEIELQIAEDSMIDVNKLSTESLKIPMLAAKYRKYYIVESKILMQAQIRLNEMEFNLFKYYNGEGTDEEYKQHPLNKLPLKGNIDKCIKVDKRYVELSEKVKNQELKVFAVQDFMKELNSRSFNIKNAIEWEKFKNGLN
jgi:hypothetical protein